MSGNTKKKSMSALVITEFIGRGNVPNTKRKTGARKKVSSNVGTPKRPLRKLYDRCV